MRRNRKSAWSRRLVAENVLTPADLIWPMFVTEGRGKRIPVESMPGVDRISVDLVAEAAEQAMALGIPAIALFPYTDAKLRTEDGARSLQSRQPRLPRHARRAQGRARHRRAARRGARSLHQPRPRRTDARWRDPQRRDAARARAPDAGAGGGRLRHHRALRHDGRPRRRHPQGAGGCRPPERADHGLRGQVRLRLLRPLPRRHRLHRGALRRQAHLPDGPRQLATRPCARWASTSPRAPTW